MQTAEIIDRLLTTELAARERPTGDVTLIEAQALAERAARRADEIGVPVCISVANSEGTQILFHRMEGSLPASAGLATDKAWTAAAFRVGTDTLGQLAQPGAMLPGIETNLAGHVVIFGGGLPFGRTAAPCGAIGISGGTVAQDIDIARHALRGRFEQTGPVPKTE